MFRLMWSQSTQRGSRKSGLQHFQTRTGRGKSFRPNLEALEDRTLLTTFTVNGTPGDDVITITGSAVVVNGNSFAYGGASALLVNGLAGADTITVLSPTVDTTVDGGEGADAITVQSTAAGSAVTVFGGLDNDRVWVESDTHTFDTILGTVTIHGGSGGPHNTDLLFVSDYGTVGGDYTVTSTTITRTAGAVQIHFFTIEGLWLTTGGGIDTVAVDSPAVTSLSVVTHGGADPVTVLGAAADSALGIATGAGDDEVVVQDLSAGATAYIFAGDGNDVVTLLSTGAGSAYVFGGLGNDTLIGAAGADVLVGGPGDDYLRGGGGRDLLIGGLGSDWLEGGEGQDILIGGRTSYDDNSDWLRGVRREWTRADLGYYERAYDLAIGGGLSPYLLILEETVFHDADTDVLYGETAGGGVAELDWFWADVATDGLPDWDTLSEYVNYQLIVPPL